MGIGQLRGRIKKLDDQIFTLIETRTSISKKIISLKEKKSLPVTDKNREDFLVELISSSHSNLNKEEIKRVYEILFTIAKDHSR